MSAVLAIGTTSLRRFFRDRSNFFFVLVLPMLLVVAVGLQFGDSGSAGRVMLVGSGPLAQEVSAGLKRQDLAVDRLDGAGTAREVVARGRADVAVLVSPTHEARWAAGESVQLTVIPGSQANGQASVATVQSVLATLSNNRAAVRAMTDAGVGPSEAKRSLDKVDGVGPSLTVSLVGQDLGDEFAGLGEFDLGAAQQLSLFMFLTALTGSAMLIQSRELGVTRRELSAPVTAGQVIGGEVLGRFVISLTQGLYMVVGTAVLFGVNWGDPLATGLVVASFAGVSAAAAMVLGSLMDNANAAGGLGIGLGLVVAGLGGSMLPIELFPSSLTVVSALTPHRWAYEAYAEIQRRGGGVADVLPQLGVLVAMTALLLPLGAWLLQRSLSRAM
ncbi:ABC transporter permease [Candidatus Microthrix parvicella]|jgi:ABC-2 type transport system permease protein|uniref:Putative ABC-type multidrug transport system, permease component n=2 Tax=Candidatus Neomicrothrix TaxID=41949 RepID=R4YWA2_9ACTN|nr:ABC transporter permease [Candidatus Microthrix parvicella]CCM62185.1 putative ABC-type multidrug transport system, permease component [Candidatus Microthrix parvicella RN1]